jgi:hypothetical protein
MTELDLGITFCQIALTTQNDKTAHRNAGNADKAYREAARCLQKSELSPEMTRQVTTKIAVLDRWLARIGEKIQPFQSEG